MGFRMTSLVKVLVLFAAATTCAGQIEWPTSGPLLEKPIEAKLFKWFDGLDFDVVRTGRFVKLKKYNLGGDSDRIEYGFVVSPNEILTLDLSRSRKAPGNPDISYLEGPYYLDFTSYEAVDFTKFAKTQLPITYGMDANDKRRLIRSDTEAFVIARACAARGLKDFAHKYFVWATQSRTTTDFVTNKSTVQISGPLPKGRREEGSSYGEWIDMSGYNDVAHSIARYQHVLAVQRLGDTHLTWADNLREFKRIQRLFGDVDKAEPASEFVSILTRMVRQKPVAPDKEHEIDHLIQELPNENAHQIMHPGGAYVFSPMGGTSDGSPAHQLAKIGRPAVPKLLDALEDHRLTRSLDWGMRSHRILRVSDIVIQTLNHIAGRTFEVTQNPWRKLSTDEIRAGVLKWYGEAGNVGELELLKRQLLSGQFNEAFNKIQEAYSSQSRQIFLQTWQEKLTPTNRSFLLGQIGGKVDADSIPILRNTAIYGDLAADRIYAAGRLSTIDADFACKILVKELAAYHDPVGYSFDFSFNPSLYENLLTNGKPDAVRALSSGFNKRPIGVRSEVLRDFPEKYNAKAGPASQSLYEALLVSELNDHDTEPIQHVMNDTDNRSSMADLAAADLGKLFPARYPYKELEFESERRRQRTKFENTWRVSQGLSPVSYDEPENLTSQAKTVVVAVKVNDESGSYPALTSLSRNMRGRALMFADFMRLTDAMSSLKMPKGRYARLIVTREARGSGLTILLDFNRLGSGDVGGDSPCMALHMRIGHRIAGNGAVSGGFNVVAYKDAFNQCLAAPANSRIDVEFDYWAQN